MTTARTAIALALMPMLVSLAGCATIGLQCLKPAAPHDITIRSDPDSNGGRPVAIDLLFITDRAALQSIGKLKAHDYFLLRDQLRRDFPKGFQIRSWEVQSGQYVGKTDIKPPCPLVGALLFANFSSEGDHRLSLAKTGSGTIVLGADDFSWSARPD